MATSTPTHNPSGPWKARFEASQRRERVVRARALELRRERDRLIADLRLAEQVQRSLLPRPLPSAPGLELGAAVRPSLHVAGDFYGAFRLDRERLGACLGDVMGHGVAAALLSVYAMQALRTKRIAGTDYEIITPDHVLNSLNDAMIAADFPGSPFLTMVYGVFDSARRTWTYCQGGHPPALLLRPGRPPILLTDGGGPLLGVFPASYAQGEVELADGDRLVLYSDGVESIRWGRWGYGLEGLAALTSTRDDRSPQRLVDDALALAEHDDRIADDVTVMVAQVSS
ncbi:PP2C family protein-serine/threonine phosphatase [Paludisphaera mucosa]|uniref:PP2C family protein-serine/threonine phosphatase n=1 Tax=Paludisphaera mucosa TaxID=3030827 RepID=A0ABT6FE53_9BACT|nr:PP2C family protein-serine/threonine phosphatase [Paludisphaera mucosa]MDG3005853.1 PP2C family protein-serine/threonine phosphatase [Paludisphaera mucosa]